METCQNIDELTHLGVLAKTHDGLIIGLYNEKLSIPTFNKLDINEEYNNISSQSLHFVGVDAKDPGNMKIFDLFKFSLSHNIDSLPAEMVTHICTDKIKNYLNNRILS